MKLYINNLSEIRSVAQQFVSQMGNNTVFAFYGSMGAGKTTFIKAVCQELGVQETVSSPTFAIINEYKNGTEAPIYHFDFYRINKVEEAFDFGYEDYFYGGNICFIEWPETIEPLLPEHAVKVYVAEAADGSRQIEIKNID